MTEATLSSKYQLVIPKDVREEAGLVKGEKIFMIAKEGMINLIPAHRLKDMKGYLKGLKVTGVRDEADR
ncbi:MAG: AbrB/MazE/SpoVT family DNA-binding domain-containing protein [Candidatus Margulisiibacteriota bacterium]